MTFLDSFFARKESIIPKSGVLKLMQKYSSQNKDLHIFVEDEDDYEFYRYAIEEVFVAYDIIPYCQKGKKNVLESYQEIDWNNYKKGRVLFFIDKDFDDLIINNQNVTDSNIFSTKYYSIENYLVNDEVFKIILNRFFGVKDTQLINLFMTKINKAHNRFHNFMIPIISLILIYRKESEHMELDKIKPSDFFYLNNLKIIKKKLLSDQRYNQIIRDTAVSHLEKQSIRKGNKKDNILSKCVDDTTIYSFPKLMANRRQLQTINSSKIYIRGKYEFWFLFEIIKNINEEIKKINSRTRSSTIANNRKIYYKLKTEINPNNIFDLLPPKIKKPIDIKNFLTNNFNTL